MKRIGYFKKEGETFVGAVALLHLHIQARITPAISKPHPSAPDYILTQHTSGSFAPELGFAWEKQTRETGLSYLAVKMDDPLCPGPIHAVLGKQTNGLHYLYWDRYLTDGDPPEELFVQEELKVVLGTFRSFHRMTTARIHQLFPGFSS